MDEPISFRWSKEVDPTGDKLRTLLDAQRSWEVAALWRVILVRLVLASSVPLWVAAAWPRFMGRGRAVTLASWAVFAVLLVAVILSERKWQRRRDALARDLSGH